VEPVDRVRAAEQKQEEEERKSNTVIITLDMTTKISYYPWR
jgi:hypothetical protein